MRSGVTNRGAMPSSDTRTTGGFDNPTTSEETTAEHRARTPRHYSSGSAPKTTGAGCGNRTRDHMITSQVLYQLS